ncbi:MAG: ATP-binding protein [Acidiferrobacterales bacterium]
MTKALIFWSSGKDSAYALHLLRREGGVDVAGLLTTVNRPAKRVAVHAVPESLLTTQVEACGLPVRRVSIPDPCPNDAYEAAVGEVLEEAKGAGISAVVFGDLFLEDIRTYRESLLAGSGIEPLFPLWGRDTHQLAAEMVAAGLRARLTCIDPKVLPPSFAGRVFDASLLADLPAGVDPCGENGEFHTFAYAGPMFRQAIAVRLGEVAERDGFVYADVLPG